MRGRLPSGPEYVDQLPGSAQAKERLKVVLETLAGTCRVQEGCQRLQVSEPRFQQLRLQVLAAGLARLEPRAAGRPPQTASPADQEITALKARLAELELELKVSQVREEIALALPNVVCEPGDKHAQAAASNDPEKKTRRQQRRRRARARSPTSRTPT